MRTTGRTQMMPRAPMYGRTGRGSTPPPSRTTADRASARTLSRDAVDRLESRCFSHERRSCHERGSEPCDDLVEHRLGELAREGVLLADVVAADEAHRVAGRGPQHGLGAV